MRLLYEHGHSFDVTLRVQLAIGYHCSGKQRGGVENSYLETNL